MLRYLGLSSVALCIAATAATADVERYHFDLCTDHVIAAGWKSQETGAGAGTIAYDPDQNTLSVDLVVTGIAPEELASAGHHGGLGPIHIHNLPQGGPQFFVQHLPATIKPVGDGFTFILNDWPMEDPASDAKVSADFVISEIRAGNAYVGLHTHNQLCTNPAGQPMTCAAPATALSARIPQVNL